MAATHQDLATMVQHLHFGRFVVSHFAVERTLQRARVRGG